MGLWPGAPSHPHSSQTLRCWQGCPRTSAASPAPSRISPASGRRRRRRRQAGRATSTTGTAGRKWWGHSPASPLPTPRAAGSRCCRSLCHPCKERWWRAHRSYTAATTQPAAGLGPWLPSVPWGWCTGGHREGTGDTEVSVPCPRSPLLQPGPGQEAWGAAGPHSPFLRDVPTACKVSTWRHEASGTRHVCVFPGQDVRLFTQLHLHVLDATTNQTKYWRELSVEAVGESLPMGNTPVTPGQSSDLGPLPFSAPRALRRGRQHPAPRARRQPWCPQQGRGVPRPGLPQEGKRPGTFPTGLIAPPANITARWAGAAGQLCVSWQPPLAGYPDFFLYEVQCCPASSPETPCGTELDPGGQRPGDPSIHPAISTHTPTVGAAAASPGAEQVHRGARNGQGDPGAAAASQPGPSLAGAGPGQHLGGPPGPEARGEVPHPGAHQARRHLPGRHLGALVAGTGCRDTPLLR